MKRIFLLHCLVIPLLFGCASSTSSLNDQETLGVQSLSSYHVVDSTGSNRLPVFDMMVDERSGKLEYILIKAPLSDSDMDIRTAPFQSKQIILIPQQFADLEAETRQFRLQVGLPVLNNAPHFSLPIPSLPNDWRATVDQYWNSILEDKE